MSKKNARTKKAPRRFDHVWRSMLARHAAMVQHYNSARNVLRLFRKSAYHFACDLAEIRSKFHEEFRNLATSTGRDVDAWMDEHFEPIEAMGDDRRDLLKAIEEGMTEQEYVKQGPAWMAAKRSRRSRPKIARTDLSAVEAPKPGASGAQDPPLLVQQVKSLTVEVRELRRDNAILSRELERANKDLERVERIADRRRRKSS